MIVKAVHTLLYKYNCVIVPGFGGVITNYRSAEIHPVKHTFAPPKKQLAFNENLVESDGLLANHIALTNNVSIEEAEKEIVKYVKSIKNTIEVEGNIIIDQIGMFSYNSEKRVQFKPLITENYLEDSFGLPELYFKPIERQKTIMQEVHSTPQKTPDQNRGPVKKEVIEETKKKSNPLFLIIPILLLIGTLGSMFVVKDTNGDMLMATLIPSLKSNVAEEVKIESEEGLVSDDSYASVEDEYATEEEVADDEWHAEAVEGDFHVIAGVFSKKRYAQRLADKYHGEVLELNGYFKVSVARSTTKQQADQQKADLTGELGNDIWILEK